MAANLETKLNKFRQYLKKMKSYEEAVGLIYWDMRTGAPKKGIAARSEVVGELSGELFKMSVSAQMGEFLDHFASPEVNEKLSLQDRKIVSECKKEYDRSHKIPPERYQEYVVLTSKSEAAWEDAKEQGDFAGFQPYLEKIVETNLEFIDLWGYEGHKYNTLLDMYEPGMTVEKLDQVFGALREQVVPLLSAIQESPHKPKTDFLHQQFEIEKQKKFNRYILQQMGYDFEAGRLDETVHPFATGLNPGDVRITTRYVLNDVNNALFSSIHEGGHALYEQNISPDLIGTPLCSGTSMGIHESQSRLWENMIGRSRSFWNRYYGDLQSSYSGQFDGVSADEYYRAINEVKPSLIRIDADELTYNLHIMVRYEIEKALFSGAVKVADLPEIWSEKYKEYLGVVPTHHGEGVLQDVHWSGGAFGYFPSYALGNMYAAQIMRTMHRELGNVDGLITGGNLLPIKNWLADKIYKHGKLLTPTEIVTQVTGEELNPDYLVSYLREKFTDIYKL